MAKKDFNLKGFLVENNLTRVSKDRKKLLNEGNRMVGWTSYREFGKNPYEREYDNGRPEWTVRINGDGTYKVDRWYEREEFEQEFGDSYGEGHVRQDIVEDLKIRDYEIYWVYNLADHVVKGSYEEIEGNSGDVYAFQKGTNELKGVYEQQNLNESERKPKYKVGDWVYAPRDGKHVKINKVIPYTVGDEQRVRYVGTSGGFQWWGEEEDLRGEPVDMQQDTESERDRVLGVLDGWQKYADARYKTDIE